MSTTRGRLTYTNQVVYDQADFFQSNGYTRVVGITPSQLTCKVFFNNTDLPWTILSGSGIPEPQVATGHLYWDTSDGYNGIRWRPNAVGYWRLLLTYGVQIVGQDYDVLPGSGVVVPGGGLKASFTGPGGSNAC